MQELHKSLTQKSKSYKKWHKFSGHETYHWLILVVLVIFAGMVIDNKAQFLFGDAAPQDNGAQYGQALEQQIPELNKEMLNLAHKFRKASPEERDAILAELMAVAEERKALVGQAITENPLAAVNTALNNQLRAQMPQEVRDLIEEKKTIRGTYSFAFADAEEYSNEEISIVERGSGKRFKVNFPDNQLPDAKTDDEVSVLGVVSDDEIAATTEEFAVTQEAGVTAGTQLKTAVIMFNFKDKTGQTISADGARAKYFTGVVSANSFIKESSFGEVELVGHNRLDGDVFGWYTIPVNASSGCDRHGWASAAENMAKTHGFNAANYDFISFIHVPAGVCGEYLGWGDVGGSPARTWIQDEKVREWVIAHEIGHNMGAWHATGWACKGTNGERVSISNNCDWVQQEVKEKQKDGTYIIKLVDNMYADFTNVMAKQNMHQHQNYHKGLTYQHFGWLSSTNSYTISPQQQPDNIYTIAPIELASAGIQALRVPRGNEYYYFEFRQPIGYDSANKSGGTSWLTGAETNGVIVRLAPNYTSSTHTKLIDTTPSSGWGESAIPVGGSFTDSSLGMTVTVQSVAPEGAKVRVTFGSVTQTCTRANPNVDITPATATGEAGTSINYTVKVTNRDSAACSGSSFAVSSTNMPSGFLQSPANFTTGALSPGGTFSQQVTVTSADTVLDGTYTFNQRAQNTSATSYVGSDTASFVVAFVDTEVPTVSMTAPTDGATITGNATVSATASDNIGVSSVVFKVDGAVIGQDASSPYAVEWDSSSVPNGGHTIVAEAKDAAGNSANSSVTVTSSNVQTGDIAPPTVTLTQPSAGSQISNGQNGIEASAQDNTRVAKIDILLDGNIIETCTGSQKTLSCGGRFLGNKLSPGTHFILVRASDSAGNVGTKQTSVTK